MISAIAKTQGFYRAHPGANTLLLWSAANDHSRGRKDEVLHANAELILSTFIVAACARPVNSTSSADSDSDPPIAGGSSTVLPWAAPHLPPRRHHNLAGNSVHTTATQ